MKKLILGALLITMAYGGWQWHHSSSAADDTAGRKLVFNRIWLDHLPTSEKDTFHLFMATTPESIGAFAEETIWHGQIERFRFEASGDEIRAVFPWTGSREDLVVHATECDNAGMDYCLEIHGSKHGVSRYFSRNGWERRGGETVEQAIDRAQQTLTP